jgi:hypothetical protein
MATASGESAGPQALREDEGEEWEERTEGSKPGRVDGSTVKILEGKEAGWRRLAASGDWVERPRKRAGLHTINENYSYSKRFEPVRRSSVYVRAGRPGIVAFTIAARGPCRA